MFFPMRFCVVEMMPSTSASIEIPAKESFFSVSATPGSRNTGLEIVKLYDYDISILDLLLPSTWTVRGVAALAGRRGVRTPDLILSPARRA